MLCPVLGPAVLGPSLLGPAVLYVELLEAPGARLQCDDPQGQARPHIDTLGWLLLHLRVDLV